jgi:hypothetical protein
MGNGTSSFRSARVTERFRNLRRGTHALISGGVSPAFALRRVLPVVIIVLVGVAFTVAVLTGGTGVLFLASLVAAAVMLIAVVFVVAFSRGREPAARAPLGDFMSFEEAARHATRGGLFEDPSVGAAAGPIVNRLGDEMSRGSARAFVATLVPFPVTPKSLSTKTSRRALLDALRKEGTGLIRLANVTGVNVAPYKEFLADAREAALRGDAGTSLRSVQLANELLRSTVEKHLVMRKKQDRDARDLENQ